MKEYKVIGVMSGTSLDGLDLACCVFSRDGGWKYRILEAKTVAYSSDWLEKLRHTSSMDGEMLTRTGVEFGRFIGQHIEELVASSGFAADFVASHGHTVFHQPERGFTLQIGDGNTIAAQTGLPVIYDFRSVDVALGGQGAPLVPIGDRLLFGEYTCCLNLGGIANLSFELDNERVAFDVCPANMMLNHLASLAGKPFDQGGELAAAGTIDADLLNRLNGLPHYAKIGSKTLGREWFEHNVLPMISGSSRSAADRLATAVEHIAIQIAASVSGLSGGKMLVTGGGALNHFLISRIREHTGMEVIVPDLKLVHFKEALVFAFLGVLRQLNEINCLASVTGASRDSSAGVMTA